LKNPIRSGTFDDAGDVACGRVGSDPRQHCGSADRQSNESVQDPDDGDRSDEEKERGRLERVRQVAVRTYVTRRRLRNVVSERILNQHRNTSA